MAANIIELVDSLAGIEVVVKTASVTIRGVMTRDGQMVTVTSNYINGMTFQIPIDAIDCILVQ